MSREHFITGLRKALVYLRIIIHVLCHYAVRPRYFKSPVSYFWFLNRALRLLLIFRHNKIVRVFNGYKLHLYLPAYPSRAFFYALETKLTRTLAGPTTVVFSMTKACTYKCKHCYQRNDSGADLDEGLMIKTVRELVETGVAMFDVEGGEPFVRLPRLLKLLQSLDDRCELWVNTTGAHAKQGMMEQLKKAGLFGLMVSIHSPEKDKHDALTGIPGSFETACEILKICRKMGLVAALNTVLSEEEIRQGRLDELMELARKLDCDYVQLIHPKPAGIWLGRKEGMQTEPALIERIQREHIRYNSPKTKQYPSLAAQVFEESEEILGCTSGAIDRFYIGASGEVQPCEFLNISFGNVKDDSFEIIYERMRSYFRKPCCDWLCCTQAEAIYKLYQKHGIEQTPLPWKITKELVENWNRGKSTPIYEKLGIYR